MREEVIEESHTGSLSGEDKTLARVREKFFWPGYSSAVKEWCKTCVNCATRKAPPQKRRAQLKKNIDRVSYAEETSWDHSIKYILVASDYFTRWVEVYAIPNQEALTVARKLVDNMFCHLGLPEQLYSDMGAQFEPRVVKGVCNMLHIKKTHTTPYHSQSDGLVEWPNCTIQTTAINS